MTPSQSASCLFCVRANNNNGVCVVALEMHVQEFMSLIRMILCGFSSWSTILVQRYVFFPPCGLVRHPV